MHYKVITLQVPKYYSVEGLILLSLFTWTRKMENEISFEML